MVKNHKGDSGCSFQPKFKTLQLEMSQPDNSIEVQGLLLCGFLSISDTTELFFFLLVQAAHRAAKRGDILQGTKSLCKTLHDSKGLVVTPSEKKITIALPSMENISKKQKTHNEIRKIGNHLSLKQMRLSEDGVNKKTKTKVCFNEVRYSQEELG